MTLIDALLAYDEAQAISGHWRVEVYHHFYISAIVYSWYAYLGNSIKESDEDYVDTWDQLTEALDRYGLDADAPIWTACEGN